MKMLQTWAVLATMAVPGAWCVAGDGGVASAPPSAMSGAMSGASSRASATADVELVEFTAQWCHVCREMDPLMEEVRSRGYRVTQVDVDEQVEVARQYGVNQVPTLLIVSRGKVVDRIVGATTPEALLPRLRNAPAGLANATVPQAARAATAPAANHANTGARHAPGAASGPVSMDVAATDRASVERKALEATVRIRVEDPSGQSFGSGTIVDVHGSEALILTCGHIFRDSAGKGRIHVELCGVGHAQPVAGELINYDLQRDVALVAIHAPVPVQPVRVAGPSLRLVKGQPLFSMGCNRGAEPTMMRGPLRSINQYLGPENLVVEGEPVDGRSGGGLFSYDGRLVGVCNAADPERGEGIYAAFPSIHQHLDAAELTFIYQDGAGPPKSAMPMAAADRTRPPVELASTREADASRAGRPGTLPGIPGVSRAGNPARAANPPVAATAAPAALDGAAELDASIARLQTQGAEVICIIRPRMDPNAKSEVVVLDRPSRGFLDQLLQERTDQGNRQMTQLRVPLERRLHPERIPTSAASGPAVNRGPVRQAAPVAQPGQNDAAWSRSAQEWEAKQRAASTAGR